MDLDRPAVLALVLAAVTVITVGIMRDLIGTIFFAITVAYVSVPIADRLERRGLPDWWAAATTSAAVFAFGLAVFLPVGAVLYVRRKAALDLLRTLPETVTLTFGAFTYVVEAGEVSTYVARQLTQVALLLARGTPVLAAKLVVFGFVVFALLYRGTRLSRALLGPVPAEYHDVAIGLHHRVRGTLRALYVIQAITAVATFAAALVLFLALGTPYPVTLAVVAGLLQFLPVVGPSLLIAALAIGDLVVGDVVGAVLMAVFGFVFVGFLPDALLRPRLARETTHLPSSLYFVGFTGGLLSLGPVGIVAGPLAIALVIELLAMLADEVQPVGRSGPIPE